MIRIDDVSSGGIVGQFRANESMIGWKSSDGETILCHAVGAVKRAEWLEGKLRVHCMVGEEASQEMLALDGFQPGDFEKLWRHFQSYCGVHIKNHRRVAEISEENFD